MSDSRREEFDLSPDLVRRKLAREAIAARLHPGCRVRVIKRLVRFDSAHDERGYTLHKLALWKLPSSEGPTLARDWIVRKKDLAWRNLLETMKGPVLMAGDESIIIALLHDVPDPEFGSRSWALLLSDKALLGWCYALDGLEILAPAGDK